MYCYASHLLVFSLHMQAHGILWGLFCVCVLWVIYLFRDRALLCSLDYHHLMILLSQTLELGLGNHTWLLVLNPLCFTLIFCTEFSFKPKKKILNAMGELGHILFFETGP